jgi:predicted NodU family carbamoyl transferase
VAERLQIFLFFQTCPTVGFQPVPHCISIFTIMAVGGGRLNDVYFGPGFSGAEIEAALKCADINYERYDYIEGKISELLARGHVIARFNGRMELGPRALGNHSILYPATDPTVNDWLNKRLGRTEFMPFTPGDAGGICRQMLREFERRGVHRQIYDDYF